MARDTTRTTSRALVPCNEQGHRCERKTAVLWAVVMKTGPGQFTGSATRCPPNGRTRDAPDPRRDGAALVGQAPVGTDEISSRRNRLIGTLIAQAPRSRLSPIRDRSVRPHQETTMSTLTPKHPSTVPAVPAAADRRAGRSRPQVRPLPNPVRVPPCATELQLHASTSLTSEAWRGPRSASRRPGRHRGAWLRLPPR